MISALIPFYRDAKCDLALGPPTNVIVCGPHGSELVADNRHDQIDVRACDLENLSWIHAFQRLVQIPVDESDELLPVRKQGIDLDVHVGKMKWPYNRLRRSAQRGIIICKNWSVFLDVWRRILSPRVRIVKPAAAFNSVFTGSSSNLAFEVVGARTDQLSLAVPEIGIAPDWKSRLQYGYWAALGCLIRARDLYA